MAVEIGKIKKAQLEKRGWLVGQFFPSESNFRDENVEIYFKEFKAGDSSDKLHKHPQGKEYLIVLKGQAKIRVGEEILSLSEGDYIAIPSNTPDKLVEVTTDLTIMGVRYPSIPDNKVFLE